jgi:hypothetical protein
MRSTNRLVLSVTGTASESAPNPYKASSCERVRASLRGNALWFFRNVSRWAAWAMLQLVFHGASK